MHIHFPITMKRIILNVHLHHQTKIHIYLLCTLCNAEYLNKLMTSPSALAQLQ